MLRPNRTSEYRAADMRELDSSWSARLDAWLADTAHVRTVMQATCALLIATLLTIVARAHSVTPSAIQRISVRATAEDSKQQFQQTTWTMHDRSTMGLLYPMADSSLKKFAPITVARAPLAKNSSVRMRYAELATAYLRPFKAKNISRELYMKHLMATDNPLSDQCAGCFLIQIKNGQVYAYDPRSIRNSTSEFRQLRMREAIHWVTRAVRAGAVDNTEFVVSTTDTVASVNRKHSYRMPQVRKQSLPIFTLSRCNFSDNIPFPMIFADILRRGFPDKYWTRKANKLREWDAVAASKIGSHSSDDSIWAMKKEQAVFRGTIRIPAFCSKADSYQEMCDEVGRTALFAQASRHEADVREKLYAWNRKYFLWNLFRWPSIGQASASRLILQIGWMSRMLRAPSVRADHMVLESPPKGINRIALDIPLLDVQVDGKCGERVYKSTKTTMEEQSAHKYIIHAEGNGFWADRLAILLFGTSVVIKQITPCGMFFEPLIESYKHYVPVDYFFRDVVRQVQWARAHDAEMQDIVREARVFAGKFLSSAGIQTYVEELLSQYSELLPHRDQITISPSAIKLYPVG
jgi:hypothetical protein